MKTLFQPKHTTKPGGLGIGLWLAHSYIEFLGGRRVASDFRILRAQPGNLFRLVADFGQFNFQGLVAGIKVVRSREQRGHDDRK